MFPDCFLAFVSLVAQHYQFERCLRASGSSIIADFSEVEIRWGGADLGICDTCYACPLTVGEDAGFAYER